MHDDQFTAMGPPFEGSGFEKAAFSTVANDAGFEFGIRTLARRFGVMGDTSGGGTAGVYGHGRFSQFGVLGTGFDERIGVAGVSVISTNSLLNLNLPPGVDIDSLSEGRGTGVLGSSGKGFGVHGISKSNTAVVGSSRTGFGVHGISSSNTAVVGTSESGFGVHGISNGAGVGVRGSGKDGPGGVFESASTAPIRLVPSSIASPEGHVAGDGGELLVTTATDASGTPVFRLWFCARAGDAASASWELVAGSRPFPGAPLSEGATGIDVKRIQMRLNMITGTQLNGDGELGAITREAVVAFQEREGIAQTGVVNADTWERLFALS